MKLRKLKSVRNCCFDIDSYVYPLPKDIDTPECEGEVLYLLTPDELKAVRLEAWKAGQISDVVAWDGPNSECATFERWLATQEDK